jgi:putative NIF3 family GTP cyclohydrolase 1 type 2
MPTLNDLAQFLDEYFAVERYGDDQGGVYHPSERTVRRIGLALEPWPQIDAWVHNAQLDALFLHRPWRLEAGQLPPDIDIGVLAYHLAFDERLTLGYNLRLADVLGMHDVVVLGHKEGRPLGMLGTVRAQLLDQLRLRCHGLFGGYGETTGDGERSVGCVAVVGAMNDLLVHEAVARGADVYLTGQYRQPARLAVGETGIGVIEIGHHRSEEWGLRALAGVLRERWVNLSVLLPPRR